MQVPFVDLKREFKLFEEELLEASVSTLSSGIYISGPKVAEFEDKCSSYLGCKHALSVGNGSDALTFILRYLDLSSSDEVICPANSFIATSWSIVAAGAKPVFCDVKNDLLFDINSIRPLINSNTKAVIAVHLTGRVAELGELKDLCSSYGIHVIEDAAQSFGAHDMDGTFTGNLSFAGAFSLHPLKNLAVYGDGGLITTNDDDLASYVKLIRNHGLQNRNEAKIWGYNSRLDELQAAFALVKLAHISEVNNKFLQIAKFYDAFLTNSVVKPSIRPNYFDIYHNYVVLVPPIIRDSLISQLSGAGIGASVHYPIPLHLQECYVSTAESVPSIPEAEYLAKSMISLPIYPTLTTSELEYVVSSFNSIFVSLSNA